MIFNIDVHVFHVNFVCSHFCREHRNGGTEDISVTDKETKKQDTDSHLCAEKHVEQLLELNEFCVFPAILITRPAPFSTNLQWLP